ncbi:MAG: flagellar brake protein [Planctomycetota bacterium]
MPARRSRTERWKDSLSQLAHRRGPIEISVAGSEARSLNWRVRVLEVSEREIVVEHPVALRRRVPLTEGAAIVGALSIGQNRWMFTTSVVSLRGGSADAGTPDAVVLSMPTTVERCQRRSFYRISTAELSLPPVRCTGLIELADAIPLEVAARAAILDAAGGSAVDPSATRAASVPTRGPVGEGVLLNIGGGGACLSIPSDATSLLDRPGHFLLEIDLTPTLALPLPVSAKLAHTRIDSGQNVHAGFAFEFTANRDHEPFVAESICRYIASLQSGGRAGGSGAARAA